MREFKGIGKTNHEIIVAYLWEIADWVPTHEHVKLSRPYGFVGSAGGPGLPAGFVERLHD